MEKKYKGFENYDSELRMRLLTMIFGIFIYTLFQGYFVEKNVFFLNNISYILMDLFNKSDEEFLLTHFMVFLSFNLIFSHLISNFKINKKM